MLNLLVIFVAVPFKDFLLGPPLVLGFGLCSFFNKLREDSSWIRVFFTNGTMVYSLKGCDRV